MNFFKTQQNPHAPKHIVVVDVSTKHQHGDGWVSRHDFKSLEQAQEVADAASNFDGIDYIATDSGYGVSPRYDVIQSPEVGDPVSYSFNGDTYPCGHIKSISKSLKVITVTDGRKFYRYRASGSWISRGIWFLVQGHISERNPHF